MSEPQEQQEFDNMFAKTHQEKNPLAAAMKDDIGIIDAEAKYSGVTGATNDSEGFVLEEK
jgi:hypothetical protein